MRLVVYHCMLRLDHDVVWHFPCVWNSIQLKFNCHFPSNGSLSFSMKSWFFPSNSKNMTKQTELKMIIHFCALPIRDEKTTMACDCTLIWVFNRFVSMVGWGLRLSELQNCKTGNMAKHARKTIDQNSRSLYLVDRFERLDELICSSHTLAQLLSSLVALTLNLTLFGRVRTTEV